MTTTHHVGDYFACLVPSLNSKNLGEDDDDDDSSSSGSDWSGSWESSDDDDDSSAFGGACYDSDSSEEGEDDDDNGNDPAEQLGGADWGSEGGGGESSSCTGAEESEDSSCNRRKNNNRNGGSRRSSKRRGKSSAAMYGHSALQAFQQMHVTGQDILRLVNDELTLEELIARVRESNGGGGDGALPAPCHQKTLPTQAFSEECKTQDHPMANTNPFSYLQQLVQENYGLAAIPGSSGSGSPGVPYTAAPKSFFVPITAEMVAEYDMKAVGAVRRGDVDLLQELHKAGKPLQCCNHFGESIMHAACRKGNAAVLNYLLQTASVSVQVCCDSGRTPLHDACWTASPSFDCITLVLKACPDLLWIADKRGSTPLAYAPRDAWGAWCTYLEQNVHLLKPRALLGAGAARGGGGGALVSDDDDDDDSSCCYNTGDDTGDDLDDLSSDEEDEDDDDVLSCDAGALSEGSC